MQALVRDVESHHGAKRNGQSDQGRPQRSPAPQCSEDHDECRGHGEQPARPNNKNVAGPQSSPIRTTGQAATTTASVNQQPIAMARRDLRSCGRTTGQAVVNFASERFGWISGSTVLVSRQFGQHSDQRRYAKRALVAVQGVVLGMPSP